MEQEEKYTSKLGAYPCIYMTLKDVNDSSYENMLLNMETAVMKAYQEHRYLLESDKIYPEEKERINDILWCRANETLLKNSIQYLSEYLSRHFDKKVMLFLDEYDVPLQNSYEKGYYEKAVEFFKTFYRVTFKDNQYLEKTVITGVSRVAKESIFSRSK